MGGGALFATKAFTTFFFSSFLVCVVLFCFLFKFLLIHTYTYTHTDTTLTQQTPGKETLRPLALFFYPSVFLTRGPLNEASLLSAFLSPAAPFLSDDDQPTNDYFRNPHLRAALFCMCNSTQTRIRGGRGGCAACFGHAPPHARRRRRVYRVRLIRFSRPPAFCFRFLFSFFLFREFRCTRACMYLPRVGPPLLHAYMM